MVPGCVGAGAETWQEIAEDETAAEAEEVGKSGEEMLVDILG